MIDAMIHMQGDKDARGCFDIAGTMPELVGETLVLIFIVYREIKKAAIQPQTAAMYLDKLYYLLDHADMDVIDCACNGSEIIDYVAADLMAEDEELHKKALERTKNGGKQ